MQYQVFVQGQSERHFVASIVEMPSVRAEGQTEAEAIAKAKTALEEQLATGKIVTIEVTPKTQPNEAILKYAGIFEHDPTFDDFMEKLAEIRRDANQSDDPT